MNRLKQTSIKRFFIQIASIFCTNAYIKGFVEGKIFKGKSKILCVPGLNCYSCPGALGSCPLGSLQAVFTNRKNHFSFYVLGTLILFGLFLGRVICGFLCLFGFIQDLLYKIPVPKIKLPKKIDNFLRFLKYAILLVMVIALPLFYRDAFGSGIPFFCEFFCPAGTLEAGLPLILKNKILRAAIEGLFYWKFIILIIILLESMFIYRPFCKYFCPLGAFYSLFNKVSILHITIDKKKCTSCGMCAKVCKMNVSVTKNPNSAECIRCASCIASCPTNALKFSIKN